MIKTALTSLDVLQRNAHRRLKHQTLRYAKSTKIWRKNISVGRKVLNPDAWFVAPPTSRFSRTAASLPKSDIAAAENLSAAVAVFCGLQRSEYPSFTAAIPRDLPLEVQSDKGPDTGCENDTQDYRNAQQLRRPAPVPRKRDKLVQGSQALLAGHAASYQPSPFDPVASETLSAAVTVCRGFLARRTPL